MRKNGMQSYYFFFNCNLKDPRYKRVAINKDFVTDAGDSRHMLMNGNSENSSGIFDV